MPKIRQQKSVLCGNIKYALVAKLLTVIILSKIRYKGGYPRCPKCIDGILSPLGIKELPEGRVSVFKCTRCGHIVKERV